MDLWGLEGKAQRPLPNDVCILAFIYYNAIFNFFTRVARHTIKSLYYLNYLEKTGFLSGVGPGGKKGAKGGLTNQINRILQLSKFTLNISVGSRRF